MLHVRLPPTRPKARRYIVNVLLGEFLGLAYDVTTEDRPDVAIELDGRTLHVADHFLATGTGIAPPPAPAGPDAGPASAPASAPAPGASAWLTAASLPARPLRRWDLTGSPLEATTLTPDLPVLYGQPPWWREEGDDLWVGLDIFGSAFFLLTRYEEAVLPDRDSHDRFPAEASITVQESFLDRPLVNEYLEVLWRAMRRLWPGLTRQHRPHRVLLSHDVDDPFCTAFRSGLQVLKSAAGDLVKRRSPALAAQRLAGAVKARPDCDPCNTFDWIMTLSEGRGWQSCFNFITDHTAGRLDGLYAIDHPWIRALMRQMHERGHEIGLHPSYQTYLRPDRIQHEFDRLRATAAAEGIPQASFGGRQHYLRWAPSTWAAWNDAGLAYDSTLTFAGRPGFRCGTCYEYPVYDLANDESLHLRERPLIVMEVSLLEYMGYGPDAAGAEMLRLAGRCRRFSGDFTLLWHNDRLIQPWEKALYQSVVEAL